MRHRLLFSIVVVSLVLATGSAAGAAGYAPATGRDSHDPDAVVAWSENAGEASVAACFIGGYGPQEARMYAMMHVAIHDALNGIDRRSRPYAADLRAARRTSADAAVAAAAHDVLVPVLSSFSFFLPEECIDAGVASVEADYTAALDAIPNGMPKRRGIELGQRAAEAILELRADDGYDTPTIDPDYRGRDCPRRVPLHTGHPIRLRPASGRGPHPLRLA